MNMLTVYSGPTSSCWSIIGSSGAAGRSAGPWATLMPRLALPPEGLRNSGQTMPIGVGTCGVKRSGPRYRNAGCRQHLRRSHLVAHNLDHRERTDMNARSSRLEAIRRCRQRGQFRINRRHDQVDVGIDHDLEHRIDKRRAIASGNRKRPVRRVACGAHFRLHVARQHVEIDARRRCRAAEAFNQSDPPARRRNQYGCVHCSWPYPNVSSCSPATACGRSTAGASSFVAFRMTVVTTSATRRMEMPRPGRGRRGMRGWSRQGMAAVGRRLAGWKPASTKAFSR